MRQNSTHAADEYKCICLHLEDSDLEGGWGGDECRWGTRMTTPLRLWRNFLHAGCTVRGNKARLASVCVTNTVDKAIDSFC